MAAKKTFYVNVKATSLCTHEGQLEIEATSEDEAREIVEDMIENDEIDVTEFQEDYYYNSDLAIDDIFTNQKKP